MAVSTGTTSRGYHKLASLMGADSDAAIFRKFGRLNMLMLLRLQAELVDLEAKFAHACIEDDAAAAGDERRKYSMDFRALNAAKAPDDLQLNYLNEMKPKLREYSKANDYTTYAPMTLANDFRPSAA